jgi:intraflagellar transport protein 20
MDSSKIDVNITFDENNQIRVLSADKYRETENVKSETIDFLKKIMSFNDMVSTLIDVLDT